MSSTIINDRTNIRGIFISSIKPTDVHLIKPTIEAFLGRVGWTELIEKHGKITARVRIDSWNNSDFAFAFKTTLVEVSRLLDHLGNVCLANDLA